MTDNNKPDKPPLFSATEPQGIRPGRPSKPAVQRVKVTVITSDHGPINKTLDVGPDGKLISNTDSCRVWSGMFETSQPVTLTGFADILWRMENTQAMILGQIKPEYANGDAPVPVVVEKKLARAPKGTIARTEEHFAFPAGVAHMLTVDFDRKGMPQEVRARIDAAGGVVKLLHETFPELALVGRVIRNSASSGLSVNGAPIEGSGGMHIFYLVADANDIPRIIETMHKRLVNLGLGWIFIGKAGQRLLRSLVDAAVNKPNGLAFEGAPILRGGLTQDHEARKPEVIEGPALDSKAAFPVLTAAEEQQFEINKNNLRAKFAKAARVVSEKYDRKLATNIATKTKKPFETVLRQVRMRHQQKLAPEWPLVFDDPALGNKTVAEVTADPARYEKETLADPLEGLSYGAGKAMVMLDQATGNPFIHSFAHGRAIYHLTLDESEIAAAIDRANIEAAVDVLADLLPRLADATGAVDRLKAQARERAGVERREINARLRPVLAKIRQEEERAEREAAAAERELAAGDSDDERPIVPAPPPMGPRGVVAELLDRLLAEVKADEPPMRNPEGRLLKIVEQSSPDMHELRDDFDYDEALESKEELTYLPAPDEPHLHIRDDNEIAVLVEQHVRLMGQLKGGGATEVALELPFCRALNRLERRSAMPVARGVSTMPVVKLDAKNWTTLRMPSGLDRETGVIFRISLELRSLVPEGTPTAEEARMAYRWLRDGWFADVCTDEQGKAALIAMALTIIQRHSFTERPDFIFSGAKAGTGKTTAANLVSAAVLGHRAAATAWSNSEEERRKSLFAIFRGGHALVVFDNLKRGTEIHDPTIEKVQTSRRYSDRKLGESEQPEIDASTVICWNGNKIAPKGDSVSRNVVVTFSTDHVRPSERAVRHESPVEWTLQRRAKILNCLYTLLLSDRQLTLNTQARTRFKAWWRAIARPIELAAEGAVNFADKMAESEAEDTEELAVASLIRTFRSVFGNSKFTSAAAAKRFFDRGLYMVGSTDGGNAVDLDQFKHDLTEAAGGDPPTNWGSVEIGIRLGRMADRAVDIEGVGKAKLVGARARNRVMQWQIVVLEPEQASAAE